MDGVGAASAAPPPANHHDMSTSATAPNASLGESSQTSQAPLRGRPPLPRLRSMPVSAASSRDNSPRSAVSEAPSLASQAMAKLAHYRAGARSFRPDPSKRTGLATGDVVAFRAKDVFLAATPAPHHSADPDAVLHILAPAEVSLSDLLSDATLHFEVIRQGQWVGFRSTASGDKLLQARRRGTHRLAFFSGNLGTWEQWEVPEASALDAVPWATVGVTLRNRRLPSCELAVELVRVGTAMMMPHASVTPRSLPAPALSAAVVEDEGAAENHNIRRMSGLLVHEWMTFVEREKKLRSALEARVEAAVDDAAGLREWAASQVEGVRRSVEEEIELLLAALAKKSSALEDAQGRLHTRLRWGIQLLEAKRAAVVGRRLLLTWRTQAQRAKFGRNVAAKLQERSALRAGARALAAWGDHCQEQHVSRLRLRAVVRRMALLKMRGVFVGWRGTVEAAKAEAEAETALVGAARERKRAQTLRYIFSGWQERTRRAGEASRLLAGMAERTKRANARLAYDTWLGRVQVVKEQLGALAARSASSKRRVTLEAAMDAWRLSVDDTFGEKRQVVHAVRVISRRRGVRALQAWRHHVEAAQAEAAQLRHADILARRRLAAKALLGWRGLAVEARDSRGVFVRFVHARAERRMATALDFWRAYAAWKTNAAAAVRHSVHRTAAITLTSTFVTWREQTAASKVFRHRVAICRRRQRAGTLAAAFVALRAHAADAVQEREMEERADGWHAGRLQARALWALVEAVGRHRSFTAKLQGVARAHNYATAKAAWEVWQQALGQETALRVAVERFQRRRAWFAAKAAFRVWQSEAQQARRSAVLLERGSQRLTESRVRWVLAVWRSTAAEEVEERQAAAYGRRRVSKMRMGAIFASWRRHTAWTEAAVETAEECAVQRRRKLAVACLEAWAAHAAVAAAQRDGVLRLVTRQVEAAQGDAFAAWRARAQEKAQRREQLRRAAAKLARVKAAAAITAWRQTAEDGYGERIRLGTVGITLAVRHQELVMRRLFEAWRGRSTEVAAVLAAGQAKRAAQAGEFLRCAFSSWRRQAATAAHRERHFVASLVERREERLQAVVYAAWRYQSQSSARNSIVVLHRVEREALKVSRAAFEAWWAAAVARRERRAALVRFVQRAHATRTRTAFAAWRGVAAAKAAQTEELRRCLVRKRLAFRQFRQWYWDSFDEDLQATLRAMFELEADAEEEESKNQKERAVFGDSRLGPSPVKSLLSSPIRKDLEAQRAAARRQEAESEQQQRENQQLVLQQQQQQRRPSSAGSRGSASSSKLSAAVWQALAAAEASPAPPLPPAGAASSSGYRGGVGGSSSAVLSQFIDWLAPGGTGAGGAPPPMSPVFEASESDFMGSPAAASPCSQASTAYVTPSPAPSSLLGLAENFAAGTVGFNCTSGGTATNKSKAGLLSPHPVSGLRESSASPSWDTETPRVSPARWKIKAAGRGREGGYTASEQGLLEQLRGSPVGALMMAGSPSNRL